MHRAVWEAQLLCRAVTDAGETDVSGESSEQHWGQELSRGWQAVSRAGSEPRGRKVLEESVELKRHWGHQLLPPPPLSPCPKWGVL